MPRFVSLFSGAGGLDLGLEVSGWDCLYASDLDPHAVETLRLNAGRTIAKRRVLADAHLEQADVRKLSGGGILSRAGTTRGAVELLAGGPPCQSWSSAGHQNGFSDPRGQLLKDYVRLATELDVRWLLFENVRGLLTARGPDGVPGSALRHVREALLRGGWQTRADLLNAADYGVPQRRVRLVLVGYRIGDEPPLPERTHSESGAPLGWLSLRDCLGSLAAPAGD